MDIDRLSDSDGDGFAPETVLTAHFTDGDAEYSLSGVVQAADTSILGTTFPYSVRSVAAVPEPAVSWLWCAGVLVLAAVRRWGRAGSDGLAKVLPTAPANRAPAAAAESESPSSRMRRWDALA